MLAGLAGICYPRKHQYPDGLVIDLSSSIPDVPIIARAPGSLNPKPPPSTLTYQKKGVPTGFRTSQIKEIGILMIFVKHILRLVLQLRSANNSDGVCG